MNKITIRLFALVAILFSAMSAHAGHSVTIKWNEPGALKIYQGGSSESYRADVPADATEFVATVADSWSNVYLDTAEGYMFESVVADGTSLNPIYNGMYSIPLSTYEGKTVVVTLEKIQYDAEMTVNVVNGRDVLRTTMWGTNREVKLNTGEQRVAYSSKYEKGVDIQAPAADAINHYLKQNGVEMEWKTYNPWDSYLYHLQPDGYTKGFDFADGTDFEVKYCDTPDEAEAGTALITLDYANEAAHDAVTFIFNITEMKTIYERDSFEATVGEEIRIVFNTKDYDITIDGTTLESTGETTPYVFTVEADRTIAISASDRVYQDVVVSFAVTTLDGVTLRKESIDGDVLHESDLTATGTINYTYKTATGANKTVELAVYQTEVSAKSPKVFISANNGWYLAASEYKDGPDLISSGVAMPGYCLNVVALEIVKDCHIVVYVGTDNANVTASDINLRDRNREVYTLCEGYNEFMIDPEYSAPLSISSYAIGESGQFAVFNGMAVVSKDSDTGAFNCNIEEDSMLHIFAGRPVPAKVNITAQIADDVEDARVVVDRFHEMDTENATVTTFRGCEVAVTPGTAAYTLDGEQPAFSGDTHVFAATGNHQIVISNRSSVVNFLPQTDSNLPVEFYNLQGHRITTPIPGQPIIIRQGPNTLKTLAH